MTIPRATKKELEMNRQAHLYDRMAASLRAMSIESRIKRGEQQVGA